LPGHSHALPDFCRVEIRLVLTVFDRAAIRHAYYVEQQSIRQIALHFGIARQSVRKALESAEAPPYTLRTPRAASKLAPYRERIAALWHQNPHLPRKQRYTAQRIFQIIQAEGFTGSPVTVRVYVANCASSSSARPRSCPCSLTPARTPRSIGARRRSIWRASASPCRSL
jgi:hypothetical protein